MFLRNLFKRAPPPEPLPEKFDLDALYKRAEEEKQKELKKIEPDVNKAINEILESKKTVLNDLKKLAGAKQSEEVHPKLLKSATEARKLLVEKIHRALSNIERCPEFSPGALDTANRRLAKSINLTTDAMVTHGRYVRTVFEPELLALQYSLRKLHGTARMTNEKINTVVDRMKRLDSLLFEIKLLADMDSSSKKIRNEITTLEASAKEIENRMEEKKQELRQLTSSEEFKRISDAEQERERIGSEIESVKEKVKNMFSDVGRGLRKFENLLYSGVLHADRGKREILKICINSPEEVLYSDEKISAAEELLHEITKLLENGKIELGDRKKRKKLESMRELPTKLWESKRRLDALMRELEALQSDQDHSVRRRISEVRQSIEEQKSKLNRAKTSIEELKRKLEATKRETADKRANVERVAGKILGINVKLIF